MGREAQKGVVLDAAAQTKLEECVAAVTAMRYGPDGPPENTTFAEIEQFGHEVGRQLGQAINQQLISNWPASMPSSSKKRPPVRLAKRCASQNHLRRNERYRPPMGKFPSTNPFVTARFATEIPWSKNS